MREWELVFTTVFFQAHVEAEGSRANVGSRVRDHRLIHNSTLTDPVTSEAALHHALPPAAPRKAAWSVVNREGLVELT